jgi:hypothetical protein
MLWGFFVGAQLGVGVGMAGRGEKLLNSPLWVKWVIITYKP